LNPFNTVTRQNWVLPVSILSMVLGFMMTAAWVTKESRSRLNYASGTQQDRVGSGTIDFQEKYDQLSDEVSKLRAEKTKLERALGDQGSSSKALNEALQEMKMQAALSDVEGPGVTVTLKDSAKGGGFEVDQAIHDFDLLRVVNELWNAGAEAIAVNGHRMAIGVSIRCVGSVIMVDNIRIAPPVVIRAIGDPQTLNGALNLPGGVLSEIRSSDPTMATIELVRKMRLQAYNGSTAHKYALVAKDAK